MMESTQLQHLRKFAASARRGTFGLPTFKLDGVTGEYHGVGRANHGSMNGKRFGTDPLRVIAGFQKIRKGEAPILFVNSIASGNPLPLRAECGDDDESTWEGGKDPWTPVTFLPCWEPETRIVWLFSAASDGSRDAVANHLEAYASYIEAHAEDQNKVPLIDLDVDDYTNTLGRKIYVPRLDLMGWIELPPALFRVTPPPPKEITLIASPKSKDEPAAPVQQKPKVKKAKTGVRSDFDEDTPF
jgi:hypothetical protein